MKVVNLIIVVLTPGAVYMQWYTEDTSYLRAATIFWTIWFGLKCLDDLIRGEH